MKSLTLIKLIVVALLSSVSLYAGSADLIVDDMWTDLKIVMVGQEFTIGYKIKNNSSSDISRRNRVQGYLYVDGQHTKSQGTDGLSEYNSMYGNFKISIASAGTHSLKIIADPNDEINENNDYNNSKTITIVVHDYTSYIQDCMATYDAAIKLCQSYKYSYITRAELQASIGKLAVYSDDLALLSTKIKPEKGLGQFNLYVMLGTKKLSAGLWNIWTGCEDFGKEFTIGSYGNQTAVPIGQPYLDAGYDLILKSQVDFLIAVTTLMKS